MIDLHTHTFLSDGVLTPSELVYRAEQKGYEAIAITDHVDSSNLDYVVNALVNAANDLNKWNSSGGKISRKIIVIPGVEITYVPPKGIKEIVKKARALGAKIIVVHGETIVEPVIKGTNKAAIMAGADILAHPGLILPSDVSLAKKMGTHLEITAREGSCLTNGYVAGIAVKIGAKLIFSSDTHRPEDLITDNERYNILQGSGLNKKEIAETIKNASLFVKKIIGQYSHLI